MKNKEFFDNTHARQYLSNTLIMFKGLPIYIQDVARNEIYYRFTGKKFNGQELNTISLKDKDISMVPVKLGLMNFKHPNANNAIRTCDVMRVPIRAWRVGLSTNNIALTAMPGEELYNFEYDTLLCSETLYKTIMNIYPNFKKVLKILNTSPFNNNIAFSRRFAIQDFNGKKRLIYSKINYPVGEIKDEIPVLFDRFQFLQQVLDKVVK